jgi:hypothetical protein
VIPIRSRIYLPRRWIALPRGGDSPSRLQIRMRLSWPMEGTEKRRNQGQHCINQLMDFQYCFPDFNATATAAGKCIVRGTKASYVNISTRRSVRDSPLIDSESRRAPQETIRYHPSMRHSSTPGWTYHVAQCTSRCTVAVETHLYILSPWGTVKVAVHLSGFFLLSFRL